MKTRVSLAPIKTFARLLTGLAIIVLLTAGCQAGQPPQAPPDYRLLANVDLSSQAYSSEILARFSIEDTAAVDIFYTIPNINTTYFDLSLIGPDGGSQVILHGEDYRTDENGGGTWAQRLEPGTYQLALSTQPSPGHLSVYWKQQ